MKVNTIEKEHTDFKAMKYKMNDISGNIQLENLKNKSIKKKILT